MADSETSHESRQKLISTLNLVQLGGAPSANGSLPSLPAAAGVSQLTVGDTQLAEFERGKRRRSAVLSLKNGTWEENEERGGDSDPDSAPLPAQKRSGGLLHRLGRELGSERSRTWSIVAMLGLLNVAMILFSVYLEQDSKVKEGTAFRLLFKEDERRFELLDDGGSSILTLNYGVNIPDDIKPIKCSKLSKDGCTSYLCRDWLYRASLSIGIDSKPNKINCYNVEWRSYTSKEVLKDCIELKDGRWFGMGQVRDSPWPLNQWAQPMAPFVTSAQLSRESPFGSIIRRYWLSSKAVSISVPLDIPLHISFNETLDGRPSNKLCFQANVNHHPYSTESEVKLEYTVCTGNELKALHTEFSKNWTQSSQSYDVQKSAELSFISEPIWSTHQLPNLNQTELDRFTKSIYSLNNNVTGFLLIDSRWESSLGDLEMNRTRFPNANDTFKAIANRGWKTMLTVTPFIDINARMLLQASSEKRIVLDDNLKVPLLTKCTPGEDLQFCAVLDIMQKDNGEWFKRRLQEQIIHRYGIEALMFQGIEVSRMPQYQHNQLHNIVNPDYYQVYYMDIAGSTAKLVGMSTGAGVKDFQGFLRVPPLANDWAALASIIPTVLSLGLIGFPVINTGSVGGDLMLHERDDELFVRWLELSLFLPIVQFARVDAINQLDIAYIKAFKKYENIRKSDLLPAMTAALVENNQHGWPIVRPMWWLEPAEPDYFLVKDQFAIGDDIIVAPILRKAQTKRDVLLPRGVWQDMITLKSVKGGKTLYDYRVELNQIAYFRRLRTEPGLDG